MVPEKRAAAKRRRTSGEDKPREGDEDRQLQTEEEKETATGEAIEGTNFASLEKVTDEKSPVVVFAHGAGAPSSSDWMIRFKFFLNQIMVLIFFIIIIIFFFLAFVKYEIIENFKLNNNTIPVDGRTCCARH